MDQTILPPSASGHLEWATVMEMLLDDAPVGMVLLDAHGRYLRINPQHATKPPSIKVAPKEYDQWDTAQISWLPLAIEELDQQYAYSSSNVFEQTAQSVVGFFYRAREREWRCFSTQSIAQPRERVSSDCERAKQADV